jgi:hypothetical protein
MKIYHYGRGCDFFNTLTQGTIAPRQLQPCIDSFPGVWCSLQEEWNADSHLLAVCPDGIIWTTKMSLPCVAESLGRIEVDSSIGLIGLKDFQRLRGVQPKVAKAMAKEARRVGIEPDDWLFAIGHIPASQWLSVEFFTGEGWQAASGHWRQEQGEG